MMVMQDVQEIKNTLLQFIIKSLADYTAKNPVQVIEAIGLYIDSNTGIVTVGVSKENHYKESIKKLLTAYSPAIQTEFENYLKEGYEYHLKEQSLNIREEIKHNIDFWSDQSIAAMQCFDAAAMDAVNMKTIAIETFINYIFSSAFTKINKIESFTYVVKEKNETIAEAILNFNKIKISQPRYFENYNELKNETVEWLTGKMRELSERNPLDVISLIAFDMDTYEGMTFLSVNTKEFFTQTEFEATTANRDTANLKYSIGECKYTAFEELRLFTETEWEKEKQKGYVQSNWGYSTELGQLFTEALLAYQNTDAYKKLHLSEDAFVFAADHDTNSDDAIKKFTIIKTALA
jgi:hypothetical protein